MSIAHLCNHTVVVYRATTARDSFGDTVPTWAALDAPDGPNARPNQNWSGAQQDHGPGEQQNAARQWFLLPAFDVAERDVLYVSAGPEAGTYLRVVSVTKPTRQGATVHHIECNVETWPDGAREIAV